MTFGMRTAVPLAPRSLLLFSCILLMAQACTPQPVTVTRQPVMLDLVAADSFAPLIDDVVAAYEESRPWVRVNRRIINTALAERVLRDGGADLALLSWIGGPGNEGQLHGVEALWLEGFALDSVAVIVHPASPLTEIGLAQLGQIFRGQMQEWDGTLLTVVSREDGSGTRAAFEAIVLEGEDTTLNAVVMPSSEAVLEYVASTPGAIGYISSVWLGRTGLPSSAELSRSTELSRATKLSALTQAWPLNEGVRVLPVEGFLPTEQTVGDGSYPLWRQLYLASRGEPDGEAREFAQWLLQRGGLVHAAAVAKR